jgi:hypothetical protein
MHLVRVTSRTREVSTEMNAVVCEEAQAETGNLCTFWPVGAAAASRGGDQCETRD